MVDTSAGWEQSARSIGIKISVVVKREVPSIEQLYKGNNFHSGSAEREETLIEVGTARLCTQTRQHRSMRRYLPMYMADNSLRNTELRPGLS